MKAGTYDSERLDRKSIDILGVSAEIGGVLIGMFLNF